LSFYPYLFVVLLSVKIKPIGVGGCFRGCGSAGQGDRVGVDASSEVWCDRWVGYECGGADGARCAGR